MTPILLSFLLIVVAVTCVFIAFFQVTLPRPISDILTVGVLFVTVLSAVLGVLLDSLGYFEEDAAPASVAATASEPAPEPWVVERELPVPLPPILDFDDELRAFAKLHDGDLPAVFDPFVSDYRRLKTNTMNRTTIASDLRADLNPIGVLYEEGSEGYGLYENVSDRLFRYIGTETGHVTVDSLEFYGEDGDEASVVALRDQVCRVEFSLTNDGDAADVEVEIRLHDEQDAVIASRTCPVGIVNPGATTVTSTDIYVPSEADHASTSIRMTDPGRTVGRL
ncbi:hypothetical protein [Haloarchaeobius sp. TZWWS8]|uniref:hypothetical protein n=1 Tax=Haloarchaeobius sp. TZWWS8 TaxID=3446121 RepID=UPI003EBFF7CD